MLGILKSMSGEKDLMKLRLTTGSLLISFKNTRLGIIKLFLIMKDSMILLEPNWRILIFLEIDTLSKNLLLAI